MNQQILQLGGIAIIISLALFFSLRQRHKHKQKRTALSQSDQSITLIDLIAQACEIPSREPAIEHNEVENNTIDSLAIRKKKHLWLLK